MIPAIIGAIGGLAQSVIGSIAQNQTNKANAKLAEYQFEANKEMWNLENEYNTPKATMERLTDVGINPRAFQQLGQFANSAQAPQYQSPQYESPLTKFSESAQVFQTLVQSLTQLQNIESLKEDTKKKSLENQYLENYLISRNDYMSERGYSEFAKGSLLELDRAIKMFGYDMQYNYDRTYTMPKKFIGLLGNEKLYGNELRRIEKEWKDDRFSFFKKTGIDTESGDSYMNWLRVALRFLMRDGAQNIIEL